MIKTKSILVLLLITSNFPLFTKTFDNEFVFELEDLFDDEEEVTINKSNNFIEEESDLENSKEMVDELKQVKQKFTACEVVMLLTGSTQGILAQELLLEDIYRHTNPNNIRSLLNLPGFYHHYFYPNKNYFWAQLFYNHMSNGYYTKDSDQLQSYILLNNPNLIQRIEDIELDQDVPAILAIFANMKLEQRRTGFMFGGQHVWDSWHVRAYTPVYYLEQNLSLTNEEQQLLERYGLPAGDDPMDFARNHLIIDKLGIGDSRIEVGYTAYEDYAFLARVGGLFTLPTAFAFKKGLYGTHFSKSTPTPSFNLLTFVNLLQTNQAVAIAQGAEFLIAAVDRLSTILLETGLGNEGHVGIGIFADSQLALSNCWTLRSKSSLEYLTPRTEKRFYIMKKDPADFLDRNYTSTDPVVCEENLAFLNTQLVETLFPTMFKTRINPGYIFLWNTSLTYHGEKLDCMFGYDLYWQDKEKLGRIKATPQEIERLRTNIAIKPCAYQSKLFGDLIYKKKGRYRDYHFGLHLDATFVATGIGHDFTAAFYFDTTI